MSLYSTLWRRGRADALRGGALTLACMWFATGAGAAAWVSDIGVRTEFSVLAHPPVGVVQPEGLTFALIPYFSFRGEGARLRVSGAGSLTGLAYTDSAYTSKLLPALGLDARLEAIDNFFFVESGVRVEQTVVNPFGVASANPSGNNIITTSVVKLNPSIETNVGRSIRLSVRSENALVRDDGSSTNAAISSPAGYVGRQSAFIEQSARPFGWRLEAARSRTRYAVAAVQNITQDQALATLRYALSSDFSFGVRSGAERNDFDPVASKPLAIHGFELVWRPSERTDFSALADQRYFGRGWRVGFKHRQPFVAWNMILSRDITTASQLLAELSPTGDVAGLIDSMLTTRYPDPIDRASKVQELMAQNGLPSVLQDPAAIYAQNVSLETLAALTISFNGTRNSLAWTIAATRLRDLPGVTVLTNGTPVTNNDQRSFSLAYGYRLTPLTTLSAAGSWRSIQAAQSVGTDRTLERTLQARITWQLRKYSSAYAGGRYLHLSSSVTPPGKEAALFLGADYRF